MPNKLNCAFAALCCAWLCSSTFAFAEFESDGFSSGVVSAALQRTSKVATYGGGYAKTKAPLLSMHAVSTQFAAPFSVALTKSESSIAAHGDEFAGLGPRIQCRDLEKYLDGKPRINDPFACWLKPGENPGTYEVGQPEFTYVTESSPRDAWAEFLAGKGPRPLKLSAADAAAQEYAEAALQAAYDEGTTIWPSEFNALDPFWTRLGQGDRFSSRGTRTGRQGTTRGWTSPRMHFSHGQMSAPPVASKPMSGLRQALPEPRWPNPNVPLRVYISGTVAAARDGLVSHEIKSALRQWCEASNGKVRYVLTDQYTAADIVFVCEVTSDHRWAENVTEYHNAMYDRVRVFLLEETLLKLAPKRVRGLCLHEVGHAFGIRNHSDDSHDAMSLAATDDFHPVLGLSNNDRKLIAKLYP